MACEMADTWSVGKKGAPLYPRYRFVAFESLSIPSEVEIEVTLVDFSPLRQTLFDIVTGRVASRDLITNMPRPSEYTQPYTWLKSPECILLSSRSRDNQPAFKQFQTGETQKKVWNSFVPSPDTWVLSYHDFSNKTFDARHRYSDIKIPFNSLIYLSGPQLQRPPRGENSSA